MSSAEAAVQKPLGHLLNELIIIIEKLETTLITNGITFIIMWQFIFARFLNYIVRFNKTIYN